MKTAYIYNIVWRWIFVIAVALIILMNYLSNAIPFGGQTMAEVSAKYPTLVTPAGYAFSIWGIIYLTLAVFAYFQLTRGKRMRFYKMIWPYFIVNVVANSLWLVAFQNEYLLISVVLMAVILITLAVILRLFYRLRRALNTTHRYFFQVPFSLYFGWVSIASIVNVASWLQSLNITFLITNEKIFGVAALSAGALLSLYLLIYKKDYIYTFAVAWAFVGIWFGQSQPAIVNTAKFTAIALLAACAVQFTADRIKVARYGKVAA